MEFTFISHRHPDAPNATGEMLAAWESKWGIKFPPTLKEYYLRHNGAEIEECSFEKDGLGFCVILIYALEYGTMPLEKMYECAHRNKAIPSTYIPLALDEDEDDYYWDSKSGNVFYLSLENVEHPIPICGSVDEFFHILNESTGRAHEKAPPEAQTPPVRKFTIKERLRSAWRKD